MTALLERGDGRAETGRAPWRRVWVCGERLSGRARFGLAMTNKQSVSPSSLSAQRSRWSQSSIEPALARWRWSRDDCDDGCGKRLE